MVYLQAINYIRQLRQLGFQDDVTRAQLLRGGWQFKDVEEAFDAIDNPNQPSSPRPVQTNPSPTQPVNQIPSGVNQVKPKSKPKRWFYYVLIFILLVPLIAFSLGYYLSNQSPSGVPAQPLIQNP